jgi:hypothetical protein
MSNKNPFELRTEVLAMAKEYMDQAYHMNVNFVQTLFEQGKKSVEEMQAALTPYSAEDLIAKANEMYSFVSKRDPKDHL